MNKVYYKRPEILAHSGFDKGHAIIEASAGTGKTFTLEHLVLDLLIEDRANIEEILVVTFTEAATRELRERIRTLIRSILDETLETPDDDLSLYWAIDDVKRGRLREALFRFDGAAISTIHGFCQRILSEQAFLGGRVFEQEHVDGKEIFGQAFREEVRFLMSGKCPVGKGLGDWIARGESLQDLETLLYTCHREGVPERCTLTPLWDPQGLTRALEGLPSPEILKEAAEAYFKEKNIYKGFIKHVDFLEEVTALAIGAQGPQEQASLVTEWAKKERTVNNVKNRQIDFLLQQTGQDDAPQIFTSLNLSLNEIMQRTATGAAFFAGEMLPRLQARLKARKHSLGLIDYDDMLLGVQEALNGPGAELLLNLLRKRWKYALVDEFQDTDAVQWDIFRKIFVESSDGHCLYVIGDPKQAIYGFRGADVHTYQAARKHLLKEEGAGRLPLIYNFRSTRSLIDSLNLIFTLEDEQGLSFFSGLNSYDEPVECGNTSRTAVEGSKPAAPVHLLHLYNEGEPLKSPSLRKGLACFISEEILRLTSDKSPLITGSSEDKLSAVKLSDIYILTRTTAEGQEIGETLRRYNIAHAFYKQEGLFGTAEAEHVYRILMALDSPADRSLRMSAWLTPFFQVPLQELPAWQETGANHPLTTLFYQWKKLADSYSWPLLFDRLMVDSGLSRRLVFSGNERALTNYLHLFELLQSEAYSRPISLAELSRSLKARIDGRKKPEGREGDVQRLETDRDAVQILTMHKAKGLEAEVVFIAGGFGNPGSQGIETNIYHIDNRRCLHVGRAFGEIAAALEQETEEENERLAYVALTRAKSRLYLPYFGNSRDQQGTNRVYGYKGLGRFYSKLQKQLDLLADNNLLAGNDGFQLREVSCRPAPPSEKKIAFEPGSWPPENLLTIPPSSAEEAEKIAEAHRGIILTSYSRISRGKEWQAPAGDNEAEEKLETGPGEMAEPKKMISAPEDDEALPGGRETGLFLHDLLENVYPEEDCRLSLEDWVGLPQVTEQAALIARQHGFDINLLPLALTLVYRGYKSPIYQENLEKSTTLDMPDGISAGQHRQAEMSFAYPIPEKFHPLILSGNRTGSSTGLPFKALRGYLQGLIDLVFEYNGKFYLLDWKSDRLPAYNLEALNSHVTLNYTLQARIYTLALIRQLNLTTEELYTNKFGGILYSFIRGIKAGSRDAEGEGIWYSLPSWSEITSWETDLLERREWGGEVIEPAWEQK